MFDTIYKRVKKRFFIWGRFFKGRGGLLMGDACECRGKLTEILYFERMTQTCSISTSRKISYCIMSTLPLIFSIFLFKSIYAAVLVSVSLLIVAIVLLAIPVLVVINVVRKKVIVGPDWISYTGLFSEKTLPFHSIKGYRFGFKNIYLEPMRPGDPTIVIGHYRDLENGWELKQWIKEAFKDLNTADLASQHAAVLANIRLGATEEARKKTLTKVNTLTLIYNVVCFPLVLILILDAGKTALTLLLIYPFIGILLMISGRGLIKFQSNRQRSICSFVTLGIFVPGFALLIKSMAKDQVLDTTHLWVPALGISLLLFTLIYVTGINTSMGMLRAQVMMMILTALVYGFGSTLQANWVFDPSDPAVYDVTILGSRVSQQSSRLTDGKDESYYLAISPWGPRHETEEVAVSWNLYRLSQKGDTLQVHLGEGLLHIPWFFITNDKVKIGEKKE